MWSRTLIHKFVTGSARRKFNTAKRRRSSRSVLVEMLEDRSLMALMTAVSYEVGGSPQALASGDLNGDSQADLVAANYSSNSVSVLLGNAGGTLPLQANLARAPSRDPSYWATSTTTGGSMW